MDTSERLALFQGMVGCCHKLFFWTYDANMYLRDSNCPSTEIINYFSETKEQQQILHDYATEHSKPTILTGNIGTTWLCLPEKENGDLKSVHVLGPFFIDSVSESSINDSLHGRDMPPELRRTVVTFLKELPVISINRVFEYAIMMFYCITGEQIAASDLHYRKPKAAAEPAVPTVNDSSAHGTYEAEREMVRMVREGNLNYKSQMHKISMTGSLGNISTGDPMRKMKNAVIVGIVLFSRAAMEGGLSPELAYTLSDYYLQSIEACTSINEMMEFSHMMQEDYITRVHRCRTSNLSQPMQTCCDYISIHLEDAINMDELAGTLAYSKSYLFKKFQKEMGMPIKTYINERRIERAKFLLRETHLSVQEISERLQFCSQSYFTNAFRKSVGMTPTLFRESLETSAEGAKEL